MMRKTRIWAALGGALLAIIGLSVVLSYRQPQPPTYPEKVIYPAGTPSPAGYAPGLVIVRGLYAAKTLTPYPGVGAVHIDYAWNAAQADLTVTPNWAAVSTRVAYADAQGLKSWLSLQIMDSGVPAVYAPAGVPTVAISGCSTTKYAPDYSASTFRNAYATAVASLMTAFGSDARVAGFAIQMGDMGEAYNIKDQSCDWQDKLEAAGVDCTEFQEAVVAAAYAHRAGTAKALTLAANVGACAYSPYSTDYGSTRFWMNKLNLTPTVAPAQYIGMRYNGLAPDDTRAWMYYTPSPYGRLQTGYTYPEWGGAYYEPQLLPASIPTADRQSHADYMLLAAANSHADNVFIQEDWYPYISSRVLSVITQTLGTTAGNSPLAWVWFRDSEYLRQVYSAGRYENSGVPGSYTHLASVVSAATPTTYCAPSVRTTAQAVGGATPPVACTYELSTPAAPESRNALAYASGSTVGIDIDDTWTHGGNVNNSYRIDVTYLDNNTGTLTLAYEDTAGTETTQTISKAGGGSWVTATYTVTAALYNGYTTHDLELRVTDAQTLLNSLVITYLADVSTPTPAPSSTATATATRTRTPRPTVTPVTATPTPLPTATPNWPTVVCPAITPVLNATLAEWAAVTPIVLDGASAAVVQPAGAATPTAGDLSGRLYCGTAGNVLYLAGVISDTTVTAGTTYGTTGSIGRGDAVRITLDGLRDGLRLPGEDDRDLYVSPGGRVLDFDSRPISATLASAVGVGSWRFELAIAGATFEVDTLSGARWGMVWGLRDDDDGTGLQCVLGDVKRMGVGP
jgi:hypothetical protein